MNVCQIVRNIEEIGGIDHILLYLLLCLWFSIAFTMLSVTDPEALGAPLKKPEGAKWAEPLKIKAIMSRS